MNWYNVLMKGVRDYSDKKNTVYLVDEFKNDIVFSRSCVFQSKIWFKCKCYKVFI